MNVLIDSNGWIEYFSDGKNAEKYSKYIEKASKKTCISPAIVIYEVYKKIKRELNESKANEAIAYIIDSTRIIGIDEKIAVYAAEISLEKKLAMADAIIKAVAELNNAAIITSDKHFKGLTNTKII